MNLFWVDSSFNNYISYDNFFQDLLKEGHNHFIVQDDNPYCFFLKLIRNLISGKNSILLDFDLSVEEIIDLGLNPKDIGKTYLQPDLSPHFRDISQVLNTLKDSEDKIEVEMFTSGTTGRPKKVSQTLKNLIRAVKVNEKMRESIWGLAYSPSHYAGLQVFFQAFFNTNTIVYIFNKKVDEVYKSLLENQVTHLSCTPTFLKMLIPSIERNQLKLANLTFGGERFDDKLKIQILEKIPQLKIKDVYASTEAGSLLRGDGNGFVIPQRYASLIKVEDKELFVHQSLMGKSASYELGDDWYRTGDLVEYIDQKRFKFMSRKSEMINVGGYKVNPHEVEKMIQNVEGVKDVIVFAKKNSLLGNVVVAKVLKEDGLTQADLKLSIIKYLKESLQEFKIPRMIKFIDKLELTRTGKVKK